MAVKRPKHEKRHRQPFGTTEKPVGVIVHCTVSNQIENSPRDRHAVVDYLASKRLSVPVVIDDEYMTEMVPQPHHGYHAKCLSEAHGIEQIGQATWTRAQWLEHRETIVRTAKECAWFLAEKMQLPVTPKNLKRFVVGHKDDHKLGGCSDHWDPGHDYPWDVLYAEALKHAREVRYSVVATKDDEKRARQFRAKARKRAWSWAKKKVARGWRVAIERKPLRSDLED